MPGKNLQILLCFLLLVVCLGQAACTPGQMRKSADREVWRILRGKSSTVPNSGGENLDVTPPTPVQLDKLAKSSKNEAFLAERAFVEKNARVLPLADALKLAVTHNREYLGRKEELFTAALDLTLVRHEFSPIFTGVGSGFGDSTQTPVTSTTQTTNSNILAPAVIETTTTSASNSTGGNSGPSTSGTSASSVTTSTTGTTAVTPQVIERQVTTLVTDNSFTVTGEVGASVLTRTGAKLAATFTNDFLRLLTGNITNTSESVFAATLTQPLLRGAGYRATMENLTQAERSLMYSIRDFTQYRKSFAVETASNYYRTLQARDAARNAYLAYEAFEKILGSERALAKEDRRTSSQLGLIEQASLRYKRLWINSVRTYEDQLDDLKIFLGVPVQTQLILDEKELVKLNLADPGISETESLQTALVTRLDLYNARNTVEDSERKIKVMAQNLLPQLDFRAGYTAVSDPGSEKVNINFDRRSLQAGLDVDLRLDKKADRNAYRAAELAQQTATRDLDLAEETVRAELRADWRELATVRKQYEIAVTGVNLSLRRLEEERLLNELGRGTARDLIDAQQDLIEAQDALTAARVNFTLTRLRLWKNMGVLYIKKDGAWERVLKQAELLARHD